ncbi:MAG: methyltransferase, partial [Lachnospiraceae bacterium]|nr:methyltransferase [Lachnospiraceae bacterium]
LIFQLHSCGCNELLVPAMIEAGVDIWCGQPMNNKKMLYEKYGKDIILGVELPPVSEDADDETIEAAAKAFVEEYKEYPIMAVTRFCSQKYVEAVYRQSRIALCGE